MEKVFIGWVQWTGKSTIVRELCSRDPCIANFSFGDRLVRIAKEKYNQYQNFHLLSNKDRNDIVIIVKQELSEILKENKSNILLFDNHYTVYRSWNIQNAFIDENIMFYDKLVLITAPAEEVCRRISTSQGKERVDVAAQIGFISMHQETEEKRAIFLSEKYKKDLFRVVNIDLGLTISQIDEFIK